jgi:hypothetical protein
LQIALDKLNEDQRINITNDKVTVVKES